MQQILNFIITYRNGILFIFLFSTGLTLTVLSQNHHSKRFYTSANNISAGVYSIKSEMSNYFKLGKQNKQLMEENATLRMLLIETRSDFSEVDTLQISQDSLELDIKPAYVIKNSFKNRNNYLTIKLEENQSVKIDQGVIAPQGIVGIVDAVNGRYARVASVLSSSLSLNARLVNSNVIGSLVWNGRDPYTVQLIDVPRMANPVLGDTIYTGRQSLVFPQGIAIGTISDISLTESGSLYRLDVSLIQDPTDLGTVYVVDNRELNTIQQLDTLSTR